MSTLESYIGAMVEPDEPRPVGRPRMNRACSVPECGNRYRSSGYCLKHWQRWRRHGDAKIVFPMGRRKGELKPMSDNAACKVIKSTDYPRLTALLQKDCLSFSEIGERFGVSRERIRQLALKLGIKRGHERTKTCTVTRCTVKVQEAFERHFARLIAACPKPVAYVRVKPNGSSWSFHHHAVVIEGKRWDVRAGSISTEGYRQTQTEGKRPCVVQFPDGFMVIPESAPKTAYIAFALNPDTRRLTKTHFHGWPDYWNAWHLLETGQETG